MMCIKELLGDASQVESVSGQGSKGRRVLRAFQGVGSLKRCVHVIVVSIQVQWFFIQILDQSDRSFRLCKKERQRSL